MVSEEDPPPFSNLHHLLLLLGAPPELSRRVVKHTNPRFALLWFRLEGLEEAKQCCSRLVTREHHLHPAPPFAQPLLFFLKALAIRGATSQEAIWAPVSSLVSRLLNPVSIGTKARGGSTPHCGYL